MAVFLMIYLAQVIHLLGPDVSHPAWDTLIGLHNSDSTPTIARFRIWNEDDGSIVQWTRFSDGQLQDHCDVTLKPYQAWAATFIPDNGFNQPYGSDCGAIPGSFRGHATIELFKQTPFGLQAADPSLVHGWSMVSGGNWDQNAPSAEVLQRKQLNAQKQWIIPYAIPHFENSDHSGPNSYVTGLSIQNFDSVDVNVIIQYTVNQNYPQAGQSWSFGVHISANGGLRTDLAQMLEASGYPADLNSEGSIVITSDVAAKLFPSAIIATENYLFSAGESFVD